MDSCIIITNSMIKVTCTELRNKLNCYLELSSKKDIYVTKYGKIIAVITSPKKEIGVN